MTKLTDKVRLLVDSGLFDERWYVQRYPDVARCGMSPAEHFVRIGQHIGRQASAEDAAKAAHFLAACRPAPSIEAGISDELRGQIARWGLFDPGWYRDCYGADLRDGTDLLANYLERSAADPSIDPGPLFSTASYARRNRDTGSTAPLVHASTCGLTEGRGVFDPHKVDVFLTAAGDVACSSVAELLDTSLPVHVVYWKDGNFFFSEIAAYVHAVLGKAGYDVTLDTDLARPDTRNGSIIVVAPHEFCVHGPGRTWDEALLRRLIYLNTEQWHTGWFSLAYHFLILSHKAIDMNPASASGLQKLGVDTAFLPILPIEGTPFDVGRAPLSEEFAKARYIDELTYPAPADRPYDVLFVGAANARREEALGKLAPVLADHEAFIHCPRFNGPVREGNPDMMSTSDLVQIARNSKILLNIHQGESRYFEWHRLFLFGILEGCVVLTEPCIANSFVEAGRDFLECAIEDMPERLRWLLETNQGQAELERIRANCEGIRQRIPDWSRLAA